MNKEAADETCLVPECTKTALSRGLCGGCYLGAEEEVKYYVTDWDELIDLGLAKHVSVLFSVALRDAKAKKKQCLEGEPT